VAKFVVLDPMLRGVGEHHFEYDVHMLRAAQREGWRPVLAAHRDLGHEAELDKNWEVYRTFRNYRHVTVLHKLRDSQRRLAATETTVNVPENRGGAGETIAFAGRCLDRIDQWRYARRWADSTRSYRRALDQIWSGCRLACGDQVFLPTAMPADLAGVADWARRNPAAREVDWHFEFHFPLLDAATWYAQGSRQYGHLLVDMPAIMETLLSALSRRRVHLYATTRSLAEQLAHCLGEPFQTLPLPINPGLGALRARVARRKPLRALSAGQPRSEKGADHWSAIVDGLTADYFATGRLQIALQAKSHADLPEPLGRLAAEPVRPAEGPSGESPVALAGWPLAPAEYLEFLAGANIGLLMYDPLAYHVRISGVMAELLGAGVPVVVPAGCAMADEISEAIFSYQQRLRERLPVVAHLATAELEWKTAVPARTGRGIAVGVGTPQASAAGAIHTNATVPAAVCQTAVPAHASHLLMLLERDAPNPWNRYASVCTVQRDADGRPCGERRDTIGCRDAGGPVTVLVPLESQSRQIEIRVQTAYGHEPFVLERLECCFLAAPDRARLAHSAVGRLASDPAQAAECLRDVVDNFDHYEKTARAFAVDWAAEHTGSQVLWDLTTRAAGSRGKAA
jgi:hypothetical protein